MSPEQSQEIQWLEGIIAGRQECLHSLYQAYESRLYRFAMVRLNEPADAADVVNDVMLQVWRSADRFNGQSRLSTWIFGIANHKILDHLRRRQRTETEELDEQMSDDSTPSPVRETAGVQEMNLIQRCMHELSVIQQQVLQLTFIENASYGEIAEILDCPQGTVKTRVFKARKLLKKCFQRLTEK